MGHDDAKTPRSLIALLIFAGLGTGALAFRQMYIEAKRLGESAALPVLGQVGDFTLIRETGEEFAAARALHGQVWIADFIFTRCAGPCPRMTQRMADLQESLEHFGPVKLVTFSVDPEYDTPKVLAEYASVFKADPARWAFLTGDRAKIYDMCLNEFRLSAGADPADENQILHSTRFVLVDGRSRIRGYYDEEEPQQMVKLIEDVRALLRERL